MASHDKTVTRPKLKSHSTATFVKDLYTSSVLVMLEVNANGGNTFANRIINPLKAELNPICHLLALLGAHHIFHVSGLRVNY